MLDARFRPLPKWNRKPALLNKSAQFKTRYDRTLDKLEYEIRHLKGRDICVEAGYTLDQIGNDGWPRGGVRPSHPGVVLYFNSPAGAMCFPCGTYNRIEDNIHAIALTLECLRAVDRYGVTVASEQYRGFTALPAGSPEMSVEEAAILVASYAVVPKDYLIDSADAYRNAYRKASLSLHPDQGGDQEEWITFQKAALVLQKHHTAAAGGRTNNQ